MIRRIQTGFTLIEIMISVAVFSIMALLAYQVLGQTVTNSEILTDRMARLQAIQKTMILLSSDMLQAAPRPVRDELGDNYRPAMLSSAQADFALELSHGGWSNPAGLPRGTQQRSAYRIEDDELLRYHWRVMDRTFANEPVVTVLLDEVEGFAVRFLQANGEWSDTWPPLGAGGPAAQRSRPRAAEVIITLRDEGEIRRLIEVVP